jgi:uncharacterized protein (DUF1778 family)
MQLDEYVTQVHDHMQAAAALGDERTRDVAATLATAAEPAVRLAVLAALTAAAEEITVALLDSPGSPSVSVRLDGDDVRIEVTAAAQPVTVPADDGDATARISLRLSEALKAQVDAAADRDGVSVNTWLVRTAQAAVSRGSGGGGSWSSMQSGHTGSHRVTGWING